MKNHNQNGQNVSLPSDLKYLNRKKILEIIRNEHTVSINQISDTTKISRPTVKKAIESFEKKGFLQPAGKGTSTIIGGKRPDLFEFCCNYCILVISMEHINLYFTVTDLQNQCLFEKVVGFQYHLEYEDFQKLVEREIEKIRNSKEIQHYELYGISFAINGLVDRNQGIVRFCSAAPHWGRNLKLKEWLHSLYPEMIITVESLVRVAGCSLLLEENYKNAKTVLLFTDGGISACYLDQGVLIGKNALIGEIGHMTVDYNDEETCSCGSRGCFERMVSEDRIRKKLVENPVMLASSSMIQYLVSNHLIRHLFEESDKGDELAKQVVDYLAEMFSILLKNIAVNFDPECVVIQGEYAYGGIYFQERLKEARKNSRFFPEETAPIIHYDKRPLRDIQVIGGCQMIAEQFFKNPELYED